MNLTKKAENYEDQTLKWIFLLNNIYKLSKLFNDKQQHQNENNILMLIFSESSMAFILSFSSSI